MNNNSLTVTIVFESPFYKAIFENYSNQVYSFATLNLGTSEPKIQKIYNFVLFNWNQLKFYETDAISKLEHKKVNPKRLQRLVKKQTAGSNQIGTKAQLALQKQHEEIKKNSRRSRAIDKQEQKEIKFEKKQNKRMEKHRGH